MTEDQNDVNRGSAAADSGRRLSRRVFLKVSVTGAALAGAGGLSACATPAVPGGGTTPKVLALYQDSPNEGRRCAGCTRFLEPNACRIVAGEISPDGWCRYYEAGPG